MTGKGREVPPGAASRSGRAIRMAVLVLGLVGIGISGYLTYIDLSGVEPVCLPYTDCVTVLATPYARMLGVPVALLGLLIYALLTGLGLLLVRKKGERQSLIALGTYSAALAGTLYSLYLVYLEIFEIHAFCSWCLASGLVIATILVLSLRMIFRHP